MNKTSQPNTRATSVFEELSRTDLTQWQGVVSRVKDPVTARLVVQYLDAFPQLKENRAGVYLAACETVQRDRIRFAKSYRKGRMAAAVLTSLMKLGKAILGLARAVKAQAVIAECPQVPAAGKAPASVSHVEPTRVCDRMVFPVIVDPFAAQAPLVH
ncbi:MAG: hypothetical protein JF606_15215 [Burkholderiales bacterium]|nr:hypothetical protein [Burkholderiales bacterium]